MKKLIAAVMILAFAVSFFAVPAFAAMPKAGKGIVDVGNKLCPVSGGPVSGKDFVTYKGKRYGLCCPACKKPFLKSPGTYIAKLNATHPSAVPVSPAKITPGSMEDSMKTAPMDMEKKTT